MRLTPHTYTHSADNKGEEVCTSERGRVEVGGVWREEMLHVEDVVV